MLKSFLFKIIMLILLSNQNLKIMKNNLNRWIFEIPLDDISEPDATQDGVNPCICCGKEIKQTKYVVHLLTNGNLISSDQDFDNSQGLHPIGNTCKNKLPNNFYFKLA